MTDPSDSGEAEGAGDKHAREHDAAEERSSNSPQTNDNHQRDFSEGLFLEDGSVPQFDIPPPPPGLEFVPANVLNDFGTAAVPADSVPLAPPQVIKSGGELSQGRDPAAHASRELHKWIKAHDTEAIISYYPLLPHSHEKKQAMQWALEYAKREGLGPLLQIAGIEQDPHLKAHFAKLIDHAGADTLAQKLEGRAFPVDQRRGIPLLLSRCKYGTMRDRLFTLADDPDTGVRESVVRCVVHFPFHDDLHIPLLSRRVQMERNGDIRLEAVRGLLVLNRAAANTALDKALQVNPPSREILNLMTSFIAERRRMEDRRGEIDRRVEDIPHQGPERRKKEERREGDRRIMTLEEAVAALREPPAPPEPEKKPVLVYAAVAAVVVLIAAAVYWFLIRGN